MQITLDSMQTHIPYYLTQAEKENLVKALKDFALLESSGQDPHKIQSKVNAIRMQYVTNLFYLPKGGCLEEEYIADLNDIHTLPLTYFHARQDKKKIFTLSQVGFYLFVFKLSLHFCRFHEAVHRLDTVSS